MQPPVYVLFLVCRSFFVSPKKNNVESKEDVDMRKIVSLVITFGVITLASVAVLISLNNALRSNVNTVSATVAPTVVPTPTEAPTLPVVTIAPFVPVATSAPAAVATATPAMVYSRDASEKTIITDAEGNFRQMMIKAGDLAKVDYEEIVIDTWNGVSLLVNTDGVVGEVFTRETESNNVRRAGIRKESVVKNFFDANGELESSRVREGYAVSDTEIGTYNLTNIRFVQIAGEENYRLVINGKSHTGGGNGGKADPTATATPAPTQEPTQQPTQKPTPTPAPAADDTPPVPRDTVTPNPIHNPTSTPTPAPATGDAPADPTEKVTHGVRHNGYDEEAEATPAPTAEPAVEETPEPPVFESSAEAPAEEIEQVIPVEATGDVPDAPV